MINHRTFFLVIVSWLCAYVAQSQSFEQYCRQSEEYTWQARFREATIAADQAIALGKDPREQIVAANLKANALLVQTDYAAAERVLDTWQVVTETLSLCDSVRVEFDILHANNLHLLDQPSRGFRIAQRLRQANCVSEQALSTAYYCEYWATHYGERRMLDSAEYYFQKAAKIRQYHAAQKPLQAYVGYRWLGIFYAEKGLYTEAKAMYDKALAIVDKHGYDFQRAKVYYALSVMFGYAGNHTEALSYCQQGIDLMKNFEEQPANYFEWIAHLAAVYRQLGQFDKAEEYFEKALYFAERHPFSTVPYSYYGLMLNRARGYNDAKEYTKAKRFARQAIDQLLLTVDTIGGGPVLLMHAFDILGTTYYLQEQYTPAAAVYDSLFQAVVPRLGADNILLVGPYNNAALVQEEFQNYGEAIDRYNDCLRSLHATDGVPFSQWSDPFTASYVLWNRASAYENRYLNQSHQPADLTAAQQSYLRYLDFLDFVRSSYRQEPAKMNLASENRIAYQKALEMAIRRQPTQPDLTACFQYMERSRALVLLESVRRHLYSESSLSPALAAEESALQTNISRLEARLVYFHRQERAKRDDLARAALQKQLFQAQRDFSTFQDRLRKEAPTYYQARYNPKVVPLSDLQASLRAANTSLIEYFVGDTVLFIFATNGQQARLIQMPKSAALDSLITNYQQAITQFHSDPIQYQGQYEALNKRYTQTALLLYQQIVAPIADLLTENVCIVPDRALANIPFEALLTDTPPNAQEFKKMPYWVLQKNVMYALSATLYWEANNAPHTSKGKGLYGAAPTYAGAITTLGKDANGLIMGNNPLLYNQKEIATVSQIVNINSVVRSAEKATVQDFRDQCATPFIIHLSAHAWADLENSDASHITFYETADQVENEHLYLRDIYSLPLCADLVTLSACQTSVGAWHQGEGTLTLARAFLYAGAKSVTSSLWSVSDVTTQSLMQDYYRNLKQGTRKDLALNIAKRQYLQRATQDNAHPFYWAPFVHVGSYTPLRF